jgi:hypothetical protein
MGKAGYPHMREVPRVHVPGSFLLLLGVSFLLVVMLFYYFFIQKTGRRPQNLGQAQLKLRVWAAKSTGLYYCPDSALYGHAAPGRYMSQGEALQEGYTPARNEPCR